MHSKMRVLIRHRDAGSQALLEDLRRRLSAFDVREAGPGEPLGDLHDVRAIVGVGPVTGDDIRRGRFGFIQTMGTGYDQIDVAAATNEAVWVANLSAGATGNADGVAELAILLALSLYRRLDDLRRNFQECKLAQPLGRSLLGATALLIGLGDVGLAVARRLESFGMRVLATRKNPARGGPPYVEVHAAEALAALVETADLVVVCARPGAAGRLLVDEAILSRVKPGAVLINVGRGSLVDLSALERALREGRLAGAGLDVFPVEPADPTESLFSLPQVIATPHVAGVTDVNMRRSFEFIVQNLELFSRGERPRFLLNGTDVRSPRGYLPSLDS